MLRNSSVLPAPLSRLPALPLAVTLTYALAVLLQEKIEVGGGLGWDGKLYGEWVGDFLATLRSGVDDYSAQRVLPSGLIYAALRALGLERTNQQIIVAFEVANVLLVAISACSYESAARQLGVSREGRWLGAIGLFGSFALLKYSAFYPVLTDVWAFAFGMLQLQFYLKRRPYALGAISGLGAFVWPTLLPFGACMLLFFRMPAQNEKEASPAPWHLNDLAASLLVAAWLWACRPMARDGFSLGIGTGDIDLTIVRLSVVVSAGYLFWGARQLLNTRRLFDVAAYRQALSVRHTAFALALVLAVVLLRWRLSNGPSIYDLRSSLNETVFSALKAPGLFALSHVLFWGPLVLVLFCQWRDCVAAIHRAGIGLTLVALCGLALSLHAESRKLSNLAPFFYLFALQSIDRLELLKRNLVACAVAALFLSRVWIRFDPQLPGELQDFPAQMLFMVIGPWMTPAMYAVQLGVVVAGAVGVGLWLRQDRAASRHDTRDAA